MRADERRGRRGVSEPRVTGVIAFRCLVEPDALLGVYYRRQRRSELATALRVPLEAVRVGGSPPD
jgi:hypothetical protein